MQCNVRMPIARVPRVLRGEVADAAARLRLHSLGNVAPPSRWLLTAGVVLGWAPAPSRIRARPFGLRMMRRAGGLHQTAKFLLLFPMISNRS